METAGYVASVFIGILLGLIGGGGSVLTVPVLVYLFNIDIVLATAYSLFIVGITSAVGAFSYFKKGQVNFRAAIAFGIPSVIAVFFTRVYILPVIPEKILSFGSFIITKDLFLMLLFAVLMIVASYSMIRNEAHYVQTIMITNYTLIFLQGIVVGVFTGLVGAGGGFLIIPVLVNMLKIPVKTAIGTSLIIIFINSCIGFLPSVYHAAIHWVFLLSITSIAIVGILLGSYFSVKVDVKKLKPAFGWFVLVMGIYVIIKEIIYR